MNCSTCGSKEPLSNCQLRNSSNTLCKDCCNTFRSWDFCNSACENFPQEVSRPPVFKGLELTRVYDGHTHRFVEDLYLPNIYSQLYCEVTQCSINLFNPNNVEIDLIYKIKERRKTFKEEYLKDSWKVEYCADEFKGLVPILQVYTFENGTTDIVRNSFSIDNFPHAKHLISSYNYKTWQPFTVVNEDYINVSEMKDFSEDIIRGRVINGEGLFGKNDTIWADLRIDKEYKISLDINYSKLTVNPNKEQLTIPVGLYFPFSLVNYHNYSLNVSDEFVIDKESKFALIIPKVTKDEQLFAIPLEENMNILEGGGSCINSLSEIDKSFHYDKYCIFHHEIILNVVQGFILNTSVSKFPLMTGLYKSMKRLYEGKFAPAYASLVNTSNKIRKVKLVARIRGLSKKFELNVNMRPNEYKNVPIMPVLSDEKIHEINEITTRCLEIDIYEKSSRVYSETYEIVVHPVESFIYYFMDKGYSFKTYLYQLLACYCTPHTKEIESKVADAAKLVGGIMGPLSNSFDRIMKELEAIYQVLSKDMSYVTRSFNFSLDDFEGTQRISLPSTSLRLKSGNCIDLSLLLASAYEACKHEVELVLVPGHAFLAVNVTGMWIYIEATCLGVHGFHKAVEVGNEQFDSHFIMRNKPNDSNSRLVSINLARENGILPFE